MTDSSPVALGTVLEGRYRLKEVLESADPIRGTLWLAEDLANGQTPLLLRQLDADEAQHRLQRLWPVLQSLTHPQLPRCGDQLSLDGALWLVSAWPSGPRYQQLQADRLVRGGRFSAAEVLELLRQLLPVLTLLHGRGLVHGHLDLKSVIHRQDDGRPGLLELGCVQFRGEPALQGRDGFGVPAAQQRGDASEPWMDLHALGAMACLLVSGRTSDGLTSEDPASWTELQALPDEVRALLLRLVNSLPDQRFTSAEAVVQAIDALPQDRSAPVSVAVPPEPQRPAMTKDPAAGRRPTRAQLREKGAEGRVWPVVLVLALSAVIGSLIGWILFSREAARDIAPASDRDVTDFRRDATPSLQALDQRQQLFSRLRALQIDRSWFLELVDRSIVVRDQGTDRSSWSALGEEWVARLEQMPPDLRSRLGSLDDADWQPQQQALVDQGVSPRVVEQLVSAAARDLLPPDAAGQRPEEPYRQLWIAVAMSRLDDVTLAEVSAVPGVATNRSTRVMAGGARLITIRVPRDHRLVLGINGTPLMAMTVFDARGEILQARGPLRVLTLPAAAGSPVQVLITNAGMASALLTLSCRADPLQPAPVQPRLESLPDEDPDPIPDSATGAT